MMLLHCMLTPLLLAHLYLAACNVTTREHIKYVQRGNKVRGMPLVPMPGSRNWAKYSPHDRGLCGNIAAFLCGTRDESKEKHKVRSGAPTSEAKGGSDGGVEEERELIEVRVDRDHGRSPAVRI